MQSKLRLWILLWLAVISTVTTSPDNGSVSATQERFDLPEVGNQQLNPFVELLSQFRTFALDIPALAKVGDDWYKCLRRIMLSPNGPKIISSALEAWKAVLQYNFDFDELNDYLEGQELPSVEEYFNHLLGNMEISDIKFEIINEKMQMLAQHDSQFQALVAICFLPIFDIPAVEDFLGLIPYDVEFADAVLEFLISVTKDVSEIAIQFLLSLKPADGEIQEPLNSVVVQALKQLVKSLVLLLVPEIPIVQSYLNSLSTFCINLACYDEGQKLIRHVEELTNFIKSYTFNFEQTSLYLTRAGLPLVDDIIEEYKQLFVHIANLNDGYDFGNQEMNAKALKVRRFIVEVRELCSHDPEFALIFWSELKPFAMSQEMTNFFASVADSALYGLYVELGVDLIQITRDFLVQGMEHLNGLSWLSYFEQDELAGGREEL